MKFPKCQCGNIVTEDDCGACTDENGFTYCCNYNPYTKIAKEEEESTDE